MAAPDGWQEHQAGVFRTVMGGRTAEIVYSPHMPGGDWAAWISGVPVVRAVDPEAAASRVRRVIEFIEDDRPEPRPLQRFGLR